MGQRVVACATDHPHLEVIATADRGVNSGDFAACDVIVDFSVAAATAGLLSILSDSKAALVTGVTGRTEAQHSQVLAEGDHRPAFYAANFSVGVAVLNRLVAEASRALGDTFDLEVFEIHHRRKADAPSGTALQLAETAAQAASIPWPDGRRVRDGQTGLRGDAEVGTAALRGGSVAGEHTVYLFGEAERLELTHRATDRDVFVYGALRAAYWVASQPVGLYGMTDLLS
jgi:4-hydroxy-tetrahydrodipicolinate reductase